MSLIVTPAFLMVAEIEHQQYSKVAEYVGFILNDKVDKSGTTRSAKVAGMVVLVTQGSVMVHVKV